MRKRRFGMAPRASFSLLLLVLAACSAPAPTTADGVPLVPQPVSPVRLRAPLVDIRRYDIAVDIDHLAGMVEGSVTVDFVALPDAPATRLELDAAELQIRGAWDARSHPLPFTLHDNVLDIELPEPLPPGAEAVAYSAGFVAATGLLHLAGISFGLLARWPAGRIAVRAAGGIIALAGVGFLSAIG